VIVDPAITPQRAVVAPRSLALPAALPPTIAPWDPDRPPPDGYRVESNINKSMLTAGMTLLFAGWSAGVSTAQIGGEIEAEAGIDGDGIEAADWELLHAPIVGPVAAMHSLDPSANGILLLALMEVVQVSGVFLSVGAFFDETYAAVPLEVGVGPTGATLGGAF